MPLQVVEDFVQVELLDWVCSTWYLEIRRRLACPRIREVISEQAGVDCSGPVDDES